jgi:hypothetical protein
LRRRQRPAAGLFKSTKVLVKWGGEKPKRLIHSSSISWLSHQLRGRLHFRCQPSLRDSDEVLFERGTAESWGCDNDLPDFFAPLKIAS